MKGKLSADAWFFGSAEVDPDEALLFRSALIRLHESGAQSFGQLLVTNTRVAFREARVDFRRLLPPWRAREPRSTEIRLGRLESLRYTNWPGGPPGGHGGVPLLEFVADTTVLTCQVDPRLRKRWRQATDRVRSVWGDAVPAPP